ncbi:fructose-bisphosphate aldolase class I [Candidatus Saccharibacteria bacterium QS_5_54_17]|nr:MAG: fructose-bisphosphate aldolase class I [Candidatus Saccharibacteria bacterium QS_5_54_17]
MSDISATAQSLLAEGKGILAADESTSTANKRFDDYDIEHTPENRRQYRQLLFTAPEIEQYLSGAILYEETARQVADEGTPLPEVLADRGIIPGIKVDRSLKPLPNFPGEHVSQGLDNLDERLDEYAEMGMRFSKWRSVIAIGDGLPTDECITANAHVLARYAGIVQSKHMVPIVEPEVLLDGDHSLEDSARVLERTLNTVFQQLAMYRVDLGGVILKTSMALPGSGSSEDVDHTQVAGTTMDVMEKCLPAELAGIVFLSGGQTPEDAIQHLQEIAVRGPYTWPVTFSYARALQEPVLKVWAGDPENMISAQDAFLEQVKKASAAQMGAYAANSAE